MCFCRAFILILAKNSDETEDSLIDSCSDISLEKLYFEPSWKNIFVWIYIKIKVFSSIFSRFGNFLEIFFCLFTYKFVLVVIIFSQKMRKKNMKCSECDFYAYSSRSLTKHVDSVHAGKRPFQCTICDYKSDFACHLRHHINSVHLNLRP